jgi:hypothetical protein
LKKSENRVLRRIFGPRKGGSGGRLEKTHNEELHDLYTSTNVLG